MSGKAGASILGAIATFIILWLILDNMNKSSIIIDLEKKNREKDDLNDKLQKKIAEAPDIPAEVKKQLEDLISEYKNIDGDVTSELLTASSLIEIKEHPKAIGVLTKVIENLLMEKYSSDPALLAAALKKGRKNPALVDYLEHAKNDKFLAADEFHLANGLREIRNEDAHNLNVKKAEFLTWSAFLAAVHLILKIASKVFSLRKVNLIS